MKILTSATFERHEIEHEEEYRFIFFGPVTKPAWTESFYLFKDSAKGHPDVCFRMKIPEAEEFQRLQETKPVPVDRAGRICIYGFQGFFVKCEAEEETIEMVRGLVLERQEREARRLERLREKGARQGIA